MQNGQHLFDGGYDTQSPIVATYHVLQHHAGSNLKYGRGGVSTTSVIHGKPVEGSHANINEGELVFTCRGNGRNGGQFDSVFANLASVAIPNSMDDLAKQKRDLYAKVQCVGVSMSTITHDLNTHSSDASVAVLVGGGVSIRHSGKFPITPRSHIFWFIPDEPDVPGLVKPELRSIEQGDIKSLTETFDFMDVIESEPFHRSQKATMQYVLDVTSYILRNQENLGREFGEGVLVDCSNYLAGAHDPTARMPARFTEFIRHVIDQMNHSKQWNKVNDDAVTILAEAMTQDLKEHRVKQDSFMEKAIPFCASVMSVMYSRLVGTSSDYHEKLSEFYAYINPAATSLVEKFTY